MTFDFCYVYVVVYMCTLWYICVRCGIYVYVVVYMCTLSYIWIITEAMHGMNKVKTIRESRQMLAMNTVTYIYLLNLPYDNI